MSQTTHNIPVALQYQLLIRSTLAIVSLFLAGLTPFFISATAAIPLLMAALLLALSAGHICWAAINNRVLELRGIVLTLEQTAFRHRPKALLLEVEGRALRVVLRNRHHAPRPGDQVTLYILDSAQLYPWYGLHQLDSYLALVTSGSVSGS